MSTANLTQSSLAHCRCSLRYDYYLFLPGSHNQQLKHECQFTELQRACLSRDHRLILRHHQCGETVNRIGEAIQHQPDSQDARKESRTVYEQAERKQPKSPKDSSNIKSVSVQPEEQHREGFALRLVDHRQEPGSAHKNQGSY